MAKKTAKQRRASNERALEIERNKGTSKKDVHDPKLKKGVSKKKFAFIAGSTTATVIVISAIALILVGAIVAACLYFFVFRDKDNDSDGIKYAYSEDLGGYEVYASGLDITSASIPAEIDGKPVVAIAKGGFANCKSLKNITIPNSVKHIGAGAFNGCSALAYTEYNCGKYLGNEENPYLVLMTVMDDEELTAFQTEAGTRIIYDYAFGELKYMNYVVITDNVKQLGVGAFANSTELATISILPGVESIGDYAFYGCSKLATVSFSGQNPKIGAYAFSECRSLLNMTLPYGMTEIPDGMFKNSGLINLPIPASVSRIGKNAFEGCATLATLALPSSLVSIDSYAFKDCSGIAFADDGGSKTVSFEGTKIKHIGAYAFQNCKNIELINIPASVVSIGEGAFSSCENLIIFNASASGLTKLPDRLLQECEKLVVVSLSNVVKEFGDYTFYACAGLQTMPASAALTTIGVAAFGLCTGLEVVEIPDTVTSIGEQSFRQIGSLVSLKLSAKLESIPTYAFEGNEKLVSVTIPPSVKSIGPNAFYGCTALASLVLNEGLESIGYGAFDSCTALPKITALPSTVKHLGYINEAYIFGGQSANFRAFGEVATYLEYEGGKYIGTSENPYMILVEYTGTDSGTAIIHNDTKIIASGAFYANSKITGVSLPAGLTHIGDYAFANCSALESVTVPAGVEALMNGVFYSCTKLTSVSLPSALTKLPDYSFFNCTALKELTLPETVTELGISAFYGCTVLTTVDFETITAGGTGFIFECPDYKYTNDNGALYFGNEENPYLVLVELADKKLTSYTVKAGTKFIHSSAFASCTALTSVSIPDSVTEIGSAAFNGCTALTSITLPSGVTKIAAGTFASCKALKSVKAPGVTVIEDAVIMSQEPLAYNPYSAAFANCTSLSELSFGALEHIGTLAFFGCSGLKSFTIPDSVKTVGSNAFDGCSGLSYIKLNFEFEHGGFNAAWLKQTTTAMTGYIHVKYGA